MGSWRMLLSVGSTNHVSCVDLPIGYRMQILMAHDVVMDPIWTLAAWEMALHLASSGKEGVPSVDPSDKIQTLFPDQVVMLHTGGSKLALEGLAQRFPDQPWQTS